MEHAQTQSPAGCPRRSEGFTAQAPAISIIVPVYNVAPFLSACLDSLLAQTLRDFECICVNDGSTDDSPQILARYAQRDARIQVVTQANQGLSAARNTGMRHAAGVYLCFIDSDDYVHPQMLEAMHGRITCTQADVAACGLERVTDEQPFAPLDLARLEWRVLTSPMDTILRKKVRVRGEACGKVFRRELLARHAFANGIYFEDVPFWYCLLRDVKTVVWTTEPFYCHRIVSTSITQTATTDRKALSYLEGIRLMNDFYAQESNPRVLNLVRRTAIKNSVKNLFNAIACKCPNEGESLRLFALIQPRIQSMMAAGMITYRGLDVRHGLVLFFLVNFPDARYAFIVGNFFLRSHHRVRVS